MPRLDPAPRRKRGAGFKTREGMRLPLVAVCARRRRVDRGVGFLGWPRTLHHGSAKPKPEIELPSEKLILDLEAVTMITYQHQSWEENEREHAEERRLTAELIASGKKTAREIQDENSLFPMNAVIEMKWAEYSERFERTHA